MSCNVNQMIWYLNIKNFSLIISPCGKNIKKESQKKIDRLYIVIYNEGMLNDPGVKDGDIAVFAGHNILWASGKEVADTFEMSNVTAYLNISWTLT